MNGVVIMTSPRSPSLKIRILTCSTFRNLRLPAFACSENKSEKFLGRSLHTVSKTKVSAPWRNIALFAHPKIQKIRESSRKLTRSLRHWAQLRSAGRPHPDRLAESPQRQGRASHKQGPLAQQAVGLHRHSAIPISPPRDRNRLICLAAF